MAKVYQTPGVYIEEKSAFPNSAVPVPTAIPAFIGYTEKAIRNKANLTNIPTKISSFGEYLLLFGQAPKTLYRIQKNATSTFQLEEEKATRFFLYHSMKLFFANGGTDCYIVSVGNYEQAKSKKHFSGTIMGKEGQQPIGITALKDYPEPTMVVIPDAVLLDQAECVALQKESLRHCGQEMLTCISILDIFDGFKKRKTEDGTDLITGFREKIGSNHLSYGAAYYPWLHTTIVGANEVDFTHINEQTDSTFLAILNKATDLDVQAGHLDAQRAENIKKEYTKVTMVREQLRQADYYQAVALLLEKLQKIDLSSIQVLKARCQHQGIDVEKEVRQAGLGAFIGVTNLPRPQKQVSSTGITTFTTQSLQLRLATVAETEADLDAMLAIKTQAEAIIKERIDVKGLHQALLAISPLYKSIINNLREQLNLLPPSGAMAGIYSMIDNSVGVFQSPANVSVGSVVKPAVSITNEEQEDLNIPLDGKAVNAIRTFPGKGVLVWGARTLDGNSQDWRYISVRRTAIFIEQSIKYAAEAYVFQPNTADTWTNLRVLITNFLTNVWQQGALAGATAADAFSVDVGLGVTMTPVDILDGYMRILVKVALTHPAEFIVLTFQQKMQSS